MRIRYLKRFIFILFCITLAPSGQAGEVQQSLIMPLASRSLLLAGAHAGARLVVVGEYGHILLSDDGGGNWRQVVAPTRTTLTGVYFRGPGLGWAVGHDAVILRTEDGGEHWQKVFSAPDREQPLLDVWFRDARTGYAIGAYGYFLKSVDGGRSWVEQQLSEDDYHLNRFMAGSGDDLYIAGEAGTLYHSPDQGAHWAALSSPYEGSFFGGLLAPDGTLLVYGLRGHVYRSTDKGVNWRRVASGTDALLAGGRILADGRVVVVGSAGVVLLSKDRGRHFVLMPQGSREAYADILEGRDDLILLGEHGISHLALPAVGVAADD